MLSLFYFVPLLIVLVMFSVAVYNKNVAKILWVRSDRDAVAILGMSVFPVVNIYTVIVCVGLIIFSVASWNKGENNV